MALTRLEFTKQGCKQLTRVYLLKLTSLISTYRALYHLARLCHTDRCSCSWISLHMPYAIIARGAILLNPAISTAAHVARFDECKWAAGEMAKCLRSSGDLTLLSSMTEGQPRGYRTVSWMLEVGSTLANLLCERTHQADP